jgi:hypothetical protein
VTQLKQILQPNAHGLASTSHRILLAAIILAEKYQSDVPMKNITWTKVSGIFSLGEVNLMERQLLSLFVLYN